MTFLATKIFKKIRKYLFIVSLIFAFSFVLRIWHLNDMGRTWDEGSYIEAGNKFIRLLLKGNFDDPSWYLVSDHPPLARYAYGIASFLDIQGYHKNGEPIYRYDYTYSRLVSVLFSSLCAVLIFLIAEEFISSFVGAVAAVIFSMIPFFLGLSQLATLESFIIFFFTASTYCFFKLFQRFSKKTLIAAGIVSGLALLVKQSNIILFPLFLGLYGIKYVSSNHTTKHFFSKYLLSIMLIFLIAILTFVLLWPMPWTHFSEAFEIQEKMWINDVKLSLPEVFLGKLILVPRIYYIVLFIITTPVILYLLFIAGLLLINKRKNWILYGIVFWFVFPFIQSFYPFKQHGVRYIIEIYAPFSILAAIGFDYIAGFLTKNVVKKFYLFIPIFLYLFFNLLKISPYYLDYFNELVGGVNNVYQKRLFQIGWWGQGIGEAGYYVQRIAPKGSTVGFALSPNVLPPMKGLNVTRYLNTKKYDFVIVNYYTIIRDGFDDSQIRKNYELIHTVDADKAHLVYVYKKR